MSLEQHDQNVEELEQEEEQQEEESGVDVEAEQEEEGDDESVVVTISGEKPAEEEEEQAAAPTWVKDLRKQHREAQKTIRELQAQLKKPEQAPNVPVLGKKPTLEDSDWDAEDFEQKLTDWHDRRRQIEQAEADKQKTEAKQKEEWEGRLSTYNTAKTTLKVRDFEEAEEQVSNLLNVTQQGIIIQGADNSALVVYALGKNPKKAAELAGITDAVKFAFAIAKLETQLKVQSKKTAPPPEGRVTGTARVSGSVDSNLDRLRAEAEKTGDYSKVTAYRRAQKEKQKA